ncbi:MAG TPA: TusE/DsrC/DsvC family sulfur relay protein [Gammaproteobacteria bacterium]|nr:TusE/DsrC/DsvC family sulfur relay protein [Gammaproteobacteria bacterium]
MTLNIAGRTIETNQQGFLCRAEDWSEEYTEMIAGQDGVKLYNDHWELIYYFLEYYKENQMIPTMNRMVRDLGRKNVQFHDQKTYERHIYSLFPRDPARELCKLAGLPMPQPDD